MTSHRSVAMLVLLLSLPALAACSRPNDGEPVVRISGIDEKIKGTREEVRQRVAERNISLSSDDRSAPEAEITPAGDLLIDGEMVAVTAQQRALLLRYRGHVEEMAAAGAEIGLQGARLATRAMSEAVTGLFNGDAEGMQERIEAEAEKIEVNALVLCEKVPDMLEAQQALAAALPEFRPYATMDSDDVNDCKDDVVIRE